MAGQEFELSRDGAGRGNARARLLSAAGELFYREGIRAVGVDQVVKAAGVAKISLYRNFPSKDDLIVAYLEERDAVFWRDWDRALEGIEGPRDRLAALIRLLGSAVGDPTYRGCPFANFAAEFADRDHPGHRVAARSKERLRSRLAELCLALPGPPSASASDGLFLLVEGAFSASQTMTVDRGVLAEMLKVGAEALMARKA